jgi:hypothetical protein
MKAYVAALALGATVVSPIASSATTPAAPKHVHRVFDIMRKGSKIGTDTFDVSRQGDATKVAITTHILVKIAFINAYRYDHTETETWKGKQLVAFNSTTDDNGKPHEIRAAQSGGKIALTVDGEETSAPKAIVPASLWSAEVAKQPQIFDPANGKRMAVKSQDLGQETVPLNGVPRQLQHVKLSGAFPRDLWFDEDGLVKMTLLGSDNSEVTSQLRQSTASN